MVEGKTDKAVLQEWLPKQVGAAWTNAVHLECAGNRGTLLAGLRWLRDDNDPYRAMVFGLADRDEWKPADVASLVHKFPTLLVNETRHSLESHFCDATEVEAILLARDAATGHAVHAPLIPALKSKLENALADHVPHWALTVTVQRANERVRNDAQYPTYFRDKCPLPTDADIRTKLKQWSAIVDADDLFDKFDALRADALDRSLEEQYRACVEPKLFFGMIVAPLPHGLNTIKQQEVKDWLIELALESSDATRPCSRSCTSVVMKGGVTSCQGSELAEGDQRHPEFRGGDAAAPGLGPVARQA